ncbi:22K [Bovine adenovirus 7]|uniref:22K protein n=1 Tax=Bovine adenovirus 7 TaxID=10511 RepID=A0A7R7FSP1_ADEB7|nr:22K [Bovine adenovirus 7]URN46036.1 22K [Bovine adenovirus 7]BCO10934.1 22K protein [Bovine adenovirus 7]BCS90527.1 22K [Bovine adenovirus 7]
MEKSYQPILKSKGKELAMLYHHLNKSNDLDGKPLSDEEEEGEVSEEESIPPAAKKPKLTSKFYDF